jgi:hypothetical protein
MVKHLRPWTSRSNLNKIPNSYKITSLKGGLVVLMVLYFPNLFELHDLQSPQQLLILTKHCCVHYLCHELGSFNCFKFFQVTPLHDDFNCCYYLVFLYLGWAFYCVFIIFLTISSLQSYIHFNPKWPTQFWNEPLVSTSVLVLNE